MAVVRADHADDDAQTWRPLRFLSISRVALATLLMVLAHGRELPPPLGTFRPDLFEAASIGYLVFGVIALFMSEQRIPRFSIQLYGQVFGDIAAITLLMHASGGVSSGVGMLLVVSVANASMITAGRTAGLFAAVGTIAILLEQTYAELTVGIGPPTYPQAGLLGATLFATALLAHVLARRTRESEALAERRELDLANMAQVTDFIIQHMQTGVLVVAPDRQVRFLNEAANELLGLKDNRVGLPLEYVSSELADGLRRWQQGTPVTPMFNGANNTEILPHYLRIGKRGDSGTLLFLEDMSRASQHMQQLKLASLGRLTASIAHEIRNPLAAISHAGELLRESPALAAGDQRLCDIIIDQSRRVNGIIETVLQLGRKDRSRPMQIGLKDWLDNFVEHYRQTAGIPTDVIAVQVTPPALTGYFDESHLEQILTNLCDNGLRHTPAEHKPRLRVEAGPLGTARSYIDVIDYGTGIAPDVQAHIFEPFFTTGTHGTGLGLYIARELAQCNRGQLNYLPTTEGGCRFRLTFPTIGEAVAA